MQQDCKQQQVSEYMLHKALSADPVSDSSEYKFKK